VNALADAEVGKYLNDHFVSSYQKVATFRIVNGQKQGGNVASYFCTPDGRVLHAVAGPTDAATLLREARWVVETWKLTQLNGGDDPARIKASFRQAHADRLRLEHGLDLAKIGDKAHARKMDRPASVHLLLAVVPAPKLEQIYKVVFEKILGVKVSTRPVVEGG